MAKTALLFQPVLQFFDNSGDELAGGSLTFTAAGTATPKDTYADSAKAVTNPNPITLDSAGRPDNSGSGIQIWLDGSYKIVLKNSAGTTIRTEDNVTALAEASGYAAKTADYTVLSTDFGQLINVSASGASRTITLIAAATAGSGFPIRIAKSDSSANTVTIDGNASETINGATTLVLAKQYDAVKLISDGANWVIVEQKYGNLSEDSSGNVIISSGNLTLTSGDVLLTLGNATLTDGDLTLSSGVLSIDNPDSRTASVATVATFQATTSGTPAPFIGTDVVFKAESADENPSVLGNLGFRFEDVTAGSEDSSCLITTRVAGGTNLGWTFRTNSAAFSGTFTHDNTGHQVYTLPDNNETFVPYGARATMTGSTSLANNTTTKMAIAVEDWDSQGNYDPVTNYRFTVPAGAGGKYLITATLFAASTTSTNGRCQAHVYIDGVNIQVGWGTWQGGTTAIRPGTTVTTVLNLAAASYVEIYGWQTNGASSTFDWQADMSIIRLNT